MHFFQDPVLLSTITLTEPSGGKIAATGAYGQYISTGYSYLTRTDGRAFLSGSWTVSLEGTDVNRKKVAYTATVPVASPQPRTPTPRGASMAGQTITDSTGSVALLSH
jgi:hypothetical protein